MKKSLKHFWAVAVTALSLSGCARDPFPKVEGWYSLETPVVEKQFSDQVDKILKYCYSPFGNNDECDNIIDLWKEAQYLYIADSNEAKIFNIDHQQCQAFFESRDEDPEKECKWLSASDRREELESQAIYKDVVFRNARGDYITKALENQDAEMLWLLEKAVETIEQERFTFMEEEMRMTPFEQDFSFVEPVPEPIFEE